MLRIINKLLENKWFPISFRIVALIAFIGLMIIGFSSPTNDPFFLSQLSKTNLTTSFVWRLWWPMLVLSAILFKQIEPTQMPYWADWIFIVIDHRICDISGFYRARINIGVKDHYYKRLSSKINSIFAWFINKL